MGAKEQTSAVRIALLGATGRMGQTLARLIVADERFRLAGAATEPGHKQVGIDAGRLVGLEAVGVTVTDDPDIALAGADVAIDFTLPAATQGNVAACVRNGVALVLGTTGLTAQDQEMLAAAGNDIAVVYGRNMSVGVNVLTELTRLASRALGEDFDVEISEAHHRHKIDAPSGTALQLGEAVADGRDVALQDVACYDRHGEVGARATRSIGFASVRAGTIVGDHTVMFAAAEEIVEIRHRALDRAAFARGALRAARWAADRAPGFYSMNDVLGLSGR